MKYIECGENITYCNEDYSMLIDMNDIIQTLEKERLINTGLIKTLDQGLFKIYQKIHFQYVLLNKNF